MSDSTKNEETAGEEARDEAIVSGLIDLLADGDTRTFDQLFSEVVSLLPAETDDAEQVLDTVLDSTDRFITMDDERWMDLHAVLDGRCVTRRLSAEEVAAGVVVLRPDVDILTLPFGDAAPLHGGGQAELVFAEDLGRVDAAFHEQLQGGALRGAAGWLGDVSADDVIGVWFDDGTLRIEPVTIGEEPSESATSALGAAFADLTDEDDDAVDLIELVLAWFTRERDALRVPHPPLTELLAAAGLESRGDYVGRVDSGWLTPHQRLLLEERDLHTQVYGFDECCHDALELAYAAFHGTAHQVAPIDVTKALSHGSVADAFTMSLMGRSGHHLDDMARQMVGFADELVAAARGAEAAGPLHVMSVGFECLGQVVEAEDAARAALRADPEHRAANEALAGYLDVRGDAPRAIDHLRRAGVREEDAQIARLNEVIAHSAPKVARNDPCPCGSGKKYKACCIDTPTLPDEIRFRWLYSKVLAFVMHPARNGAAFHLAMHAIEREGVEESPVDRALSDLRFAELAAFDEGLLDEFLDARDPLLPDVEVDIAEGWLRRQLALYEVVDGADEEATLRDTSTDALVTVRGASGLAAGEFVVARTLPVGDHLWLGGPIILVPEPLRDSAQQLAGVAESHTWAEWIGYSQAPADDPGPPPTPGDAHHHHHH